MKIRLLLTVAACTLLTTDRMAGQAVEPVAVEQAVLELGVAQTAKMASGTRHIWRVDIEADRFVGVEVRQLGIDVVVSVADPTGIVVLEVDSPTGDAGAEVARWISDRPGTWTISAAPFDPGAVGGYEIELFAVREAIPSDSAVLQADELASQVQAALGSGQYSGIEALLDALYALQSSLPDTEVVAIADLFRSTGLQLHSVGGQAGALVAFERELVLREKAQPTDHPDIAVPLNNLAFLLEAQGRYAEAEPLYERALAIREAAYEPGHPEIATSLNNLATLYQSQGRYAEAEPLYERALAIREAAYEPGHPDIATSLNNLASLYGSQGRYVEAEPLYERALAIREAAYEPGHPDIAVSLNNLALLYNSQGRYADAEPLFERALAVYEAAYEPGHPLIATSLSNLASIYESQGQYSEAEPLYVRALAIKEAAYEPDHPEIAVSLNNLALLYNSQGRYAEAESLHERALAITEAAYEPDHPSIATSLNNLASIYEAQGQYAEAEPLYVRALAIKEAAYEPDHPSIATSLDNLAALYESQGRYAEAVPLLQRALAIHETAHEPGHPSIATSQNNLALLFESQGRYAEAESLYERALAITEAAYEWGHPDIAISLNNLADLYESQGRYAEAEPLFVRALAIFEAAYEPGHPSIATSLNHLAILYQSQGRYAEAEPLYERALAIREATYEPGHPTIAVSLNNLANLYKSLGRYAEAESLYERAMTIKEAAYEPGHPTIAVSLNNLAVLYESQGRYAEAESLYERAMTIKEAAYEPGHPLIATSLNNLALLYQSQGRYAEAEPLYERAMAIYEAAYEPGHPSIATSLNNLALLHQSQGGFAEAEPLYERALAITDRIPGDPLTRIIALNQQANLYRATGRPDEAVDLLSEAIDAIEDWRSTFGGDEEGQADYLARYASAYRTMVRWQLEDGDIEEALAYVERRRARVLLDQLATARVDLLGGVAPELRRPLEARELAARAKLAEYQQRITVVRGMSSLSDGERLDQIAELRDSLRAADDEFRVVYREIKNLSPIWQQTLARGGEPEDVRTVQRDVVGAEGLLLLYEFGEEASFVFVVPPGRAEVRAVRLEIDARLAEQLGVEAGTLTGELMHDLAGGGARGRAEAPTPMPASSRGGSMSSEMIRHLGALREALVPDEVWAQVQEAGEVVVIPDGALHHLPFETLVTGTEGDEVRFWLDDAPPVRYGPSMTVMANLERTRSVRPVGLVRQGGVLSVTDPVYDPNELEVGVEPPTGGRDPGASGATRNSYERAGGSLARLPGTAVETDSIRAAFGGDSSLGGVAVLSRAAATETALRDTLGTFRYLHLATHGLVDQTRSSLFASLALTPPSDADATEAGDDGFLQLHEIYGLRLPEIELAVLSACESNIGDAVEGEGVFALSRGFLVAGASRVIASQWAVNDESTAVLMATFFREVADAEGRAEAVDYGRALRTAQLAVKNHPDHPEWADPYYWAPFVLTGKR